MKIVRQSTRPEAALRWLAENGLQDVATENILEVRNEGDCAVILLDGSIGKSWWDDSGITAKEVHDAINEVPAGKKIKLLVNSEGGSVKEGLGIYDRIEARKGDITCRVTGYALSIASVFPLAAGRIESPDHAIWMSHEAWMSASGNKRDMRKNADMLETHDGTLAKLYAKRTGKSAAYWAKKMEDETWFTGAEAIAEGLADECGDEAEARTTLRPIFAQYTAKCRNIPENILNALAPRNGPGAPHNSAAPKTAGNNQNQTQQANTMNKKLIVALLLSHGIKNSTTGKDFVEADADADFEAGLNALASKKMQKDSSAENLSDIATIRAEMTKLHTARLNDKITPFVDAQKITKAEAKMMLAMALTSPAAEAEVMEILAAKEAQPIGGDAAGFEFNGRLEMAEPTDSPVNENGVYGRKILPELDNLFKKHQEPEARYNAMKQEFPRLWRAALRKDNGVQAANTMSATVMTNFLIMGVVTKLSGKFAAANLFTKDAEQDPFKPLAAGIRKFNTTTTDGSKVAVNPTNWATLAGGTNGNPDSVVDAVTITPDYYASGGHLTFTQLNSGFRVADVFEAKLRDLASKMAQVLTAPIITANFTTNAAVISAPAAFGFSDLADLQGKLKKSNVKNLILDGEYIARIANTPGFFQMAGTVGGPQGAWKAFGWDNVALHTDWSGAGANVRGFGCGDQAIGIIAGIPVDFPEGIPGNTLQRINVKIPDVDLVISNFVWFDLNERVYRFTNDLILGATLLDETDGCLVKSA